MPPPAGYTLDQSASSAPNVPAGYTLDKPAQTKPGWDTFGSDTFKSNLGQVGSIGDYLHAARSALGLPSIDDLMHLPASVMNWARHGNQPSGGFLSENPTADAFATGTAAIAPPDLASAKSAAGNVAAATKAGVGAAAETLVDPKAWTRAGVAGMAAHYMGLDPGVVSGVVGGSRVVSAAAKAAKKALVDRAAAATAALAPVEDTALLDDIAQGQAGKKFSKLSGDEQETVRKIAASFNGGAQPTPAPAPTPAPTPAPATPPPAAAPAPEPPATPGKTIADIAREELTPQTEPQPETPAPAKPSKGKMSRAQAQAADEYSLRRSQKSAEELAQFITKNPAQAQQVLDYLDNPGLPDGAPQEVINQARDINWTNLKHSMKQDQLARIQQAGGNVTQSDVMDLKNVSAPSLVTRRLAVQRVQEILKQQKAAQAATAAPRTGMGAMKNYSGYSYNPAALTDEQIAALTR